MVHHIRPCVALVCRRIGSHHSTYDQAALGDGKIYGQSQRYALWTLARGYNSGKRVAVRRRIPWLPVKEMEY